MGEKMVSDEELEDFSKDVLDKDITQEDKIDKEAVEQSLGEMGFLWERVQEKLKKDGICFGCKKDVEFSSESIRVLEATRTEKGVIAFVGVCQKCLKKIEKEEEKTK